MTPDQLPLWRDVLTLQQQLRPEALATIRAAKHPVHPFRAATWLLLTIIAIVVWSVQLQTGASARASAAPVGASFRIPSLLSALTVEGVAGAWAPITGALAVGVLFHLVFLAIPASRDFVRRHPVAPVALGGALTLLVLQLSV